MKSIIKTVMLAITMVVLCANAYAQNSDRQRMTREQLAETQAKYITKKMAMDDAAAEKFVKTFCRFQQEVWALGPRLRKDASNRSDSETEQALKARFEHSKKILDLRKKYYVEYSKFLTQKQIERVYKLERQMMRRLDNHRNLHKR